MPKSNPLLWPKPPLILCYGVAALSVTAALIIARWLEINLQTAPVSLFLCAVMFSAWFGGIGPGLLAAALSVMAFAYYFVPPIYSLAVEAKEIPRFLIFVLSAILVGSLSAAQRRAAESLRRARDDLDATVQELKRSNEALQAENAERKRVEEALRESEDQWRDVFENNPTMYFMIDTAGTVLSVNPFGAEQLGYTVNELVGHSVLNVFYEADRDAAQRHVGICLEQLGRSMNWELRKVRKDGTVLWVRETAKAVLRAKNHPIVLIACEDITERKRAEAKLEQAFQEIQVLKDQLYKENLALKEEIDRSSMFEEIVGSSPVLQDVLARIAKVAPTDSTVLITGETGTGKELIARAIHKRSQRSSRAFVNVNCAATPPSLIASELFGHEKGAFTGALQRRLGRFELAEGGTIFLDEIGELPAETQIALLRVLQEREFERVGGTHTIRADVRVIAATNRDLNAAIAAGTFRKDLYYRLNVFPIESPPLRERQDDILLLVEYFIDRYASKAGKKIRDINKKTLKLLQSYPWPGNIRELQNVIERSVIVCETETFSIDESWFSQKTPPTQPAGQPLSDQLVTQEKAMIEAALAEASGRVSGPSGAAAKLGIPPSTLESKIRSLKISKHRFKPI